MNKCCVVPVVHADCGYSFHTRCSNGCINLTFNICKFAHFHETLLYSNFTNVKIAKDVLSSSLRQNDPPHPFIINTTRLKALFSLVFADLTLAQDEASFAEPCCSWSYCIAPFTKASFFSSYEQLLNFLHALHCGRRVYIISILAKKYFFLSCILTTDGKF